MGKQKNIKFDYYLLVTTSAVVYIRTTFAPPALTVVLILDLC